MFRKKLLALACACALTLNAPVLAESYTVDACSAGLTSNDQCGTDASTTAGDDYTLTPLVYVDGGSLAYCADGVSATDSSLNGQVVTSTGRGTNGVVINDSTYIIDGSTITLDAPDEDGTTSSDFTGKGAALAVYGDSDVTVTGSTLTASGVADLALFVDNGATVLVDSSVIASAGGTLYAGYTNSPDNALMVAPPWILGIMGNSRASNLMGTDSTLTFIDSEATSSNWAVLSTDSGSNMTLNVVASILTLTGTDTPLQADGLFDTTNPYTSRSGYATYVIGDARETFLGTKMSVGTYATIFTGGSAYYGNLVKGETYELTAADGSVHTTYTATEDVRTEITSDTFGFMAHQGTNDVTLDGVSVESGYTTFLVKSGNDTTITVENGATLTPGNGILLQTLDNDDSTTAFDSENKAFGTVHEEYAGFPTEAASDATTAGSNMDPGAGSGSAPEMPEGGMEGQMTPPTGDGAAPEKPDGDSNAPEMPEGGMGEQMTPPTGDGNAPEKPDGDMMPSGDMSGQTPQGSEQSSSNTTTLSVRDTTLTGDIFNGIGWNANALSSGNVKQMNVNVVLGSGAVLNGAIASTSCIHATYEGQAYLRENGITCFIDADEAASFAETYQATSFTISEYFNIGQVANLVSSNGLNDISVSLTDDAVWNVTGTSLITSLTLSDNATVVIPEGVTLTVGNTTYAAGTYTAQDF